MAALSQTPLKDDEDVHIFPTYGYWSDGRWNLQFHGWIFEAEADSRIRQAVQYSLRIDIP